MEFNGKPNDNFIERQTEIQATRKMVLVIEERNAMKLAMKVELKGNTKQNTADMATKILPTTTVSVFSKIVLGLQDTLLYATDFD